MTVAVVLLFEKSLQLVSCNNCKFGEEVCICSKKNTAFRMDCSSKTSGSNRMFPSLATLNNSQEYYSIILSNNFFDVIPNNTTRGLTYIIRQFYLDNNNMSRIEHFAFSGIQGLETLHLDDNFLTDLRFLSIPEMSTLE
jgi:hypothetical protein